MEVNLKRILSRTFGISETANSREPIGVANHISICPYKFVLLYKFRKVLDVLLKKLLFMKRSQLISWRYGQSAALIYSL